MLKYISFMILTVCCLSSMCVAQEVRQGCDLSKYNAFRITDDIGLLVKDIKPAYPLIAKDAKIQGDVVVEVVVNAKGEVVKACVVKGHPLLGDAAKKAALEFKFKKNHGSSLTSKGNQKYRATILVFNFRLN